MDELLLRMAKQLDSLDEASLMSLWDKYAKIVDNFEPTERWQQATLILSFIQAKRWKNQLFNYHWATRTKLHGHKGTVKPAFSLDLDSEDRKEQTIATKIPFRQTRHSEESPTEKQ